MKIINTFLILIVAGGNEKIDSMFFQDISGMSNDEIESLSFIVPMLLNGIKNYNSDGLFDNEEKELIKETSMESTSIINLVEMTMSSTK